MRNMMTAESEYTDASVAVSPALRNYLRRNIYSVNGYLKSLDARLIVALASWQTSNRIAGGLAEIGVHHGKLFFLLALSRQVGEKSLAIDLFEDDEKNTSARFGGRSRAFSTHAASLNVTLESAEVQKADSLTLTSDDILRRVGRVRIFSVDGGHLYHHVANDLPLAFSTLAPGGVIVVDDFCNSEWPEVTSATYDFVRAQEGKIVPAIFDEKETLSRTTRHRICIWRVCDTICREREANEQGSGRSHGPCGSLSHQLSQSANRR